MKPSGVAWRIFLTCWLVYCLHFASNSVREVYPALSLGDHFSLRVDEYANLHPDLFETPGRGWHINSNPGASMLAAIPYALLSPAVNFAVRRVNETRARSGAQPPAYDSPWQMARDFHTMAWQRGLDVKLGLGAFVMQTLCMAPLSALCVVLMFLVLRRLDLPERTAILLSLLFAFGTPLFFRTGTLNHNLLLGHFTFLGFVLLWNPAGWLRTSDSRRTLLAGVCAGAGILMDYSGAVTASALGLYLLYRFRAFRPVTAFALGALIPLSLLWLAQWQSFGHPFYPAQHWMPPVAYSDQGYNGVSLPQLDLIWQNGFDYRFGLFTTCPLLLLAFAAPWLRKHTRLAAPELVFLFASVAGLWLFASAVQFGRLQFNTGVRYLAPAFALLFLPAALALMRLPARVQTVLAALAFTQAWCMAMYRDIERGYGLLEPMAHVFTEGLQLPFFTVLSRMGYVKHGAIPALLILLTAAMVYLLWRPYWKTAAPPGKEQSTHGRHTVEAAC